MKILSYEVCGIPVVILSVFALRLKIFACGSKLVVHKCYDEIMFIDEEDIRIMANIRSEFATWAGMRFEIYK